MGSSGLLVLRLGPFSRGLRALVMEMTSSGGEGVRVCDVLCWVCMVKVRGISPGWVVGVFFGEGVARCCL